MATLLVLLVPAAAGAGGPGRTVAIERARYLMGAPLSIRAEGDSARALAVAVDAAFARVARLERAMTTWTEKGELRRVNQRLASRMPEGGVTLSRELGRAMRRSLDWTRRTGGLFDPALGALLDAWGVDRPPSDEPPPDPVAAREASGSRLVRVARAGDRSFRLFAARPGVRLDLGGIGKGIALDAAARVLRRAGVHRALLDFGGQVRAVGSGPEDGAFRVAIAHPEERDRPAVTLRLTAGSLATSGNAERGRRRSGRMEGHVLDPRSGRPTRSRASFSVLARTATAADALATAFAAGGLAAVPVVERNGASWIHLEALADGRIVCRAGGELAGRAEPAGPPFAPGSSCFASRTSAPRGRAPGRGRTHR